MNQRAASPAITPLPAVIWDGSAGGLIQRGAERGRLPRAPAGRSRALWKIKPFTSFLPHPRNTSAYLHISRGRSKAGAGKEMGRVKTDSKGALKIPGLAPLPGTKVGLQGFGERADGLLRFTHQATHTCPGEGLPGTGFRLCAALPLHSQGWEKRRDRRVGNRGNQA